MTIDNIITPVKPHTQHKVRYWFIQKIKCSLTTNTMSFMKFHAGHAIIHTLGRKGRVLAIEEQSTGVREGDNRKTDKCNNRKSATGELKVSHHRALQAVEPHHGLEEGQSHLHLRQQTSVLDQGGH